VFRFDLTCEPVGLFELVFRPSVHLHGFAFLPLRGEFVARPEPPAACLVVVFDGVVGDSRCLFPNTVPVHEEMALVSSPVETEQLPIPVESALPFGCGRFRVVRVGGSPSGSVRIEQRADPEQFPLPHDAADASPQRFV